MEFSLPGRTNLSALGKELPSFTGVSTFVLHSPNLRKKQLPSLSLWQVVVKKRFGLVYLHFQFGSGKIRRDWSAELFCNCLAPLKVSLAVNYVLDLAVSSTQLSLVFRLNPTEIRGHLGAFRFQVQAYRWTDTRSILQYYSTTFLSNRYPIPHGWQKGFISSNCIYLAFLFIGIPLPTPLVMNPLKPTMLFVMCMLL